MISQIVLTVLLALMPLRGNDPVFGWMPPDGVPAGWQRSGEARLFPGGALYRHIDGGAEVFHRFGFDRLAVQEYAKGSLKASVEIYRMLTAEGAASVFAEQTQGLRTQTTYGISCSLDATQILFHSGPYFVSLIAYDLDAETRSALAALAANIDTAMKKSPTD